jgi:hypothetical protein
VPGLKVYLHLATILAFPTPKGFSTKMRTDRMIIRDRKNARGDMDTILLTI